MKTHNLEWNVLGPGYGVIAAGSLVENLILGTNWFMLGTVIGFLWVAVGVTGLIFSQRELKKSEGYMLVQSGPFALTRNPAMAAHILGIMPGMCLILNTNAGILGVVASIVLFAKHIQSEERELEHRFGEAYHAYRERVSRLLPCPFSGGH